MPETRGRTEAKRKREDLSTTGVSRSVRVTARARDKKAGKSGAPSGSMVTSRKRQGLSTDGSRHGRPAVVSHGHSELWAYAYAIVDVNGTYRKCYGQEGKIVNALELYPREYEGCYFIVKADADAKLSSKRSTARPIARSALAGFQHAHDEKGGTSDRRPTNGGKVNPPADHCFYVRLPCCNTVYCTFGVIKEFVIVAVRTVGQPKLIHMDPDAMTLLYSCLREKQLCAPWKYTAKSAEHGRGLNPIDTAPTLQLPSKARVNADDIGIIDRPFARDDTRLLQATASASGDGATHNDQLIASDVSSSTVSGGANFLQESSVSLVPEAALTEAHVDHGGDDDNDYAGGAFVANDEPILSDEMATPWAAADVAADVEQVNRKSITANDKHSDESTDDAALDSRTLTARVDRHSMNAVEMPTNKRPHVPEIEPSSSTSRQPSDILVGSSNTVEMLKNKRRRTPSAPNNKRPLCMHTEPPSSWSSEPSGIFGTLRIELETTSKKTRPGVVHTTKETRHPSSNSSYPFGELLDAADIPKNKSPPAEPAPKHTRPLLTGPKSNQTGDSSNAPVMYPPAELTPKKRLLFAETAPSSSGSQVSENPDESPKAAELSKNKRQRVESPPKNKSPLLSETAPWASWSNASWILGDSSNGVKKLKNKRPCAVRKNKPRPRTMHEESPLWPKLSALLVDSSNVAEMPKNKPQRHAGSDLLSSSSCTPSETYGSSSYAVKGNRRRSDESYPSSSLSGGPPDTLSNSVEMPKNKRQHVDPPPNNMSPLLSETAPWASWSNPSWILGDSSTGVKKPKNKRPCAVRKNKPRPRTMQEESPLWPKLSALLVDSSNVVSIITRDVDGHGNISPTMQGNFCMDDDGDAVTEDSPTTQTHSPNDDQFLLRSKDPAQRVLAANRIWECIYSDTNIGFGAAAGRESGNSKDSFTQYE